MTSLQTQVDRTSQGARPHEVSRLQPSFTIAVAPHAPVIKVGRKDVVVADSVELRSLVRARDAHLAFDKQTAAYGETQRGPVTRFLNNYERPAFLTTATGMAGSLLASIAAAITTDGLAFPIFAIGAGGSFVALLAGIAASLGALDLEHKLLRRRSLSPDALAPLQRIFEAPENSALDRAVVALLAKRYAADLESRKVRGEAARGVLRHIDRAASEIDPKTAATAAAIVECFGLTHDDRGELVATLGDGDAKALENALATMAPHDAETMRPALLKLLYVGDTARPKMDYGAEARLYRVLTGIDTAKVRS